VVQGRVTVVRDARFANTPGEPEKMEIQKGWCGKRSRCGSRGGRLRRRKLRSLPRSSKAIRTTRTLLVAGSQEKALADPRARIGFSTSSPETKESPGDGFDPWSRARRWTTSATDLQAVR